MYKLQYGVPYTDGIQQLFQILRYLSSKTSHTFFGHISNRFFFQQWLEKNAGPTSSFEISRQYISTYGWSHYHDLDGSDEDEDIPPSNLPKLAENCSLFFEQNTNEMNVNRPVKF